MSTLRWWLRFFESSAHEESGERKGAKTRKAITQSSRAKTHCVSISGTHVSIGTGTSLLCMASHCKVDCNSGKPRGACWACQPNVTNAKTQSEASMGGSVKDRKARLVFSCKWIASSQRKGETLQNATAKIHNLERQIKCNSQRTPMRLNRS